MKRNRRVEILYKLITELAENSERKSKAVQKSLTKVVNLEEKFFENLPDNKIKEYIMLTNFACAYHSEVKYVILKFAINFMLDFFSIQ